MMPALTDKVAVVTGAASGIGRAIALRFGSEGARVAVLDIAEAEGRTVAQEICDGGGQAAYFRCDVTSQEAVLAAFDDVSRQLGPLDILVNCAGVAHVGTVETTTAAEFDRVFAVNVKGVYNCLKAGISAMKAGGGAILNIGSVAGMVGIPDRFAYSTSKGAVQAMTLSVARDYVAAGIRCNSISPARVHTPFVDGFLKQHYPGREQEVFEQLARTQPIGRMGEPDEIAALAVFLCSDEAAFITGSNYAVDGGFVTLKM
jgi:NAD(P)-dependent dehydrogenase (short-subunit alcohol dehydrogenase family)